MADQTRPTPKEPTKPMQMPMKGAPAKSPEPDPHAGHDMSKPMTPPAAPKRGTK